jgi:putative ABC transport system permease protein
MKTLLNRLTQWLAHSKSERDLAEEIETHRQMTESRLRAGGMSVDDAAAHSRRIMGNITLAREDARATWLAPWIESVWQDVVYAARTLVRFPAFAAAMILVMALGIGATTGVFGLLDALVLRDLPVRAPEQLVYVNTPSFSFPVFHEVRARGSQIFSGVVGWDMDRVNVAWNRELEPTEILMASGDFYSLLGVDAAIGRVFTADDDRIGGGPAGRVALISHDAWVRRFNRDASVLGRTIRIESNTHTIIGVTPPGFFGVAPGLAPEVTIPLTTNQRPSTLTSTTSSSVHMLARMRDGIGVAEANAAFQTFWPAILEHTANPGMPADRRAIYLGRAASLSSGHAGYSRVRNQFRDPLWLLLALVTLLLGVACGSAANLLLARGVARQREIAVRLAIGASRARLVRQMLTESVVWTVLASVVGLLLATWSAASLVALMTTSQQAITLDVSSNWRVVFFSTALALVTAAVCSLVPALRATRLDPGSRLKGAIPGERMHGRRWSLDESLVTAQVALTVLLLFGAGLFVRSVGRVLAQDAGIDRDRFLVVATDPEAADYEDNRLSIFYATFLERVRRIPGVDSASLSMYPPLSDDDGAWTQSIGVDGQPVPTMPGQASVYFNTVSTDYFRTIGMRLIAGRDFSSSDTESAPRVIIVNEALARRFFPGRDALGRHVTVGRGDNRRDVQIVGVVSDAKYQRLQEQPRSIAYLPYLQLPLENLFTEVRTSVPLSRIGEAIRQELRAIDAVVPIRIQTVDERIRESLVRERVVATLATALGVTALLLACAGVYGLLAYRVSRVRPAKSACASRWAPHGRRCSAWC